jgi:pyruvate-ferredoxin/flavodoxin oxidoreductase
MSKTNTIIYGNEARPTSRIDQRLVLCVYPITPRPTWASGGSVFRGSPEHWGTVPRGWSCRAKAAPRAVHGALQTGALTTTFTAPKACCCDPEHV